MAGFIRHDPDNDYIVDDDSDIERDSSSEDELDFTIHCATQKGLRVRHSSVSSKGSSAESDFEKEMNEELNQRVSALEEARKTGQISKEQKGGENPTAGSSVPQALQYDEDDVYFDSDEEEMITEGGKKKKKKEEMFTDEDLFYDPNQDDEDEKWVNKHRRSHLMTGGKGSKKLPASDAVLDCPACMTTLCLDCQKHEAYHNQYRAMFVMNCHVDFSEVLKQPPQKISNKKRHRGSQDDQSGSGQKQESSQEEEEKVHPVRCTECNTVVGVFDREEVFHFFNVLASH